MVETLSLSESELEISTLFYVFLLINNHHLFLIHQILQILITCAFLMPSSESIHIIECSVTRAHGIDIGLRDAPLWELLPTGNLTVISVKSLTPSSSEDMRRFSRARCKRSSFFTRLRGTQRHMHKLDVE
jgi:hypothetical protein